jgi:hypothetical protein
MRKIEIDAAKQILSQFSPSNPLVVIPYVYDRLAAVPELEDYMSNAIRQTEIKL